MPRSRPATSSFDPRRRDLEPYGLAFDRWTPQPMRRADRHNEIELNLSANGAITYLLGGRRVTLPSGRLAIFWAAIPHQVVEVGARHPYYVVTVPLIWFLQRQLPADTVHAVMSGDVLIDTEEHVAVDVPTMERWVRDMRRGDALARRAVLLELEARLLRLANACSRHAPATASPGGFDYVDRMLATIAAGYTQTLSIDAITRPTGLHPSYAMTLFRKLFGMTLVDCVTQHRIAHAQRLLVTTDRAIANIALASGFNSLSRFNDAFKKACACPPRAFRRQHAAY